MRLTMPDDEWRDPRTLKEFAEELARSRDELADARMELATSLEGLLAAGIPLRTAVDYWMVEVAGMPLEEWASVRGCEPVVIRQSIYDVEIQLGGE